MNNMKKASAPKPAPKPAQIGTNWILIGAQGQGPPTAATVQQQQAGIGRGARPGASGFAIPPLPSRVSAQAGQQPNVNGQAFPSSLAHLPPHEQARIQAQLRLREQQQQQQQQQQRRRRRLQQQQQQQQHEAQWQKQQKFQQPLQEQQPQQQAYEQPVPPQKHRPMSSNEKVTQRLTGDTTHSFAATTPHDPNEPRMLLHMHQDRPTTNIHTLSIPRRDPLGLHLLQLCEALDLLFRFDWNFVYWHKSPLPTKPNNKIPIVLRWNDTFSEVQLPGPQGGTIALEEGAKVEMVSWVRDAKYVEQKHLELGLEDWEKVYVVITMQRCKREARIQRLQEEQEWKDWNTELQVQALTMAKRIEASEVELSWLQEAHRILGEQKKGLEEKLKIAVMMEERLREWIREHGGLNALAQGLAHAQDQAPEPEPVPAHGPPGPAQTADRARVTPPLRSPAQAVESAFQALIQAAVQAQAEEAEAEAEAGRSLQPIVEDVPDSEENWKQQSAEHGAADDQEDGEDGAADDQEEVSVCEAEYGSEDSSEDEAADEMDTTN